MGRDIHFLMMVAYRPLLHHIQPRQICSLSPDRAGQAICFFPHPSNFRGPNFSFLVSAMLSHFSFLVSAYTLAPLPAAAPCGRAYSQI